MLRAFDEMRTLESVASVRSLRVCLSERAHRSYRLDVQIFDFSKN